MKYPNFSDEDIESSLQIPSTYAGIIKGAANHWGFSNWKNNYQLDSILESFQNNFDSKLF